MMNKPKTKTLIIALVAIVATVLIVGLVAAAIVLTAPEHAANTVITPTVAPTASPTPVPAIVPTEVHLSSNNTVAPWIKGNTLHIVGQLDKPIAGISISLYNNGGLVTSVLSDSTGKADFYRLPTVEFDYTIKANVP